MLGLQRSVCEEVSESSGPQTETSAGSVSSASETHSWLIEEIEVSCLRRKRKSSKT